MFSKLTTTVVIALVGLSGLHVAEAFTCPDAVYGVRMCCSAQELGAVGIDCTPYLPALGDCNVVGKTDYCCVLPVAGQALLCQFAPPSQ